MTVHTRNEMWRRWREERAEAERDDVESRIEHTVETVLGPVMGHRMFPRQSFSLCQIVSLITSIRLAHERGIEMHAYPVPLDLSWRWRLRQWFRRLRTKDAATVRVVR